MADKYIKDSSGQLTEQEATITSTGVSEAGDIVALDSTGRLSLTFMPVGVAAEVTVAPASENLTAGNFVNIWNDGGTVKIRKADATAAGKEANGFVLANVTAPADATVYGPSNKNTALSALTLAGVYYLATTAGGVTATAPSAAGNLVQRLGRAESATELVFSPGETWVKA